MAKKNNTPAKPKLPPEEALFQALSLCRKAGALTMGFDAVEDACVKSKAWLVMVASDASAKTVQRLDYSVGDLVDVITMPLTQDKLADISRKPVAVYAVTDRNLAKLCFDRLSDCGAIKKTSGFECLNLSLAHLRTEDLDRAVEHAQCQPDAFGRLKASQIGRAHV